MTADEEIAAFIDGTDEGWRAFEWAHDEARRTQRTLRVVHVDVHGAAADDGSAGALLIEAIARVADEDSPVKITTDLRRGQLHDVVTEVGEQAALVVVGAGAGHVFQPRLVGRTHGLLGRTVCPMVVVPGGAHSGGADVVTIGVSLSPGGLAAMHFGCAEARRSSRRVVGVRAWAEDDWKLDVVNGDYTSGTRWRSVENATLQRWLDRAHSEFPDVEVGGILVDWPVYWALEDRAPTSALVVVGARRNRGAVLPPVGPVTSWAIHHAGGAVAVVPFEDDADRERLDAPAR